MLGTAIDRLFFPFEIQSLRCAPEVSISGEEKTKIDFSNLPDITKQARLIQKKLCAQPKLDDLNAADAKVKLAYLDLMRNIKAISYQILCSQEIRDLLIYFLKPNRKIQALYSDVYKRALGEVSTVLPRYYRYPIDSRKINLEFMGLPFEFSLSDVGVIKTCNGISLEPIFLLQGLDPKSANIEFIPELSDDGSKIFLNQCEQVRLSEKNPGESYQVGTTFVSNYAGSYSSEQYTIWSSVNKQAV